MYWHALSDADLDASVAQLKLLVGGESQSVERCTVMLRKERLQSTQISARDARV